MNHASVFAATFVALYVGHVVGDHWMQTEWQATNKNRRDATGTRACTLHVVTYVCTQYVCLLAMSLVTGVYAHTHLVPFYLATVVGMLVSALTHYWADRRYTLKWLAGITGHANFYQLGAPRDIWVNEVDVLRDDDDDDDDDTTSTVDSLVKVDAPHLGTGAYAMDQSFHIFWLFVAALIISLGV